MAEAEAIPAKKGPRTWLDESKFYRAYMMSAQTQREVGVADYEARDVYRKVMSDTTLDDEGRKFVLESIAGNAGAAMGVTNLIRNAKAFWAKVR